MSFGEAMENLARAEQSAVFELGRRMGFGNLMFAASRLWQGLGQPGAFSVGPCVESCVPCPHPGLTKEDPPHKCDWCCGCGWVTKRVLEAQGQVRQLEEKKSGGNHKGGKKKTGRRGSK